MPKGNEKKHTDLSHIEILVGLGVSVGVSVIVMGVSLFVILSKQYSDEYVKWAFGVVGIIMGYWLAPGRRK
jgi:hypothetical protein